MTPCWRITAPSFISPLHESKLLFALDSIGDLTEVKRETTPVVRVDVDVEPAAEHLGVLGERGRLTRLHRATVFRLERRPEGGCEHVPEVLTQELVLGHSVEPFGLVVDEGESPVRIDFDDRIGDAGDDPFALDLSLLLFGDVLDIAPDRHALSVDGLPARSNPPLVPYGGHQTGLHIEGLPGVHCGLNRLFDGGAVIGMVELHGGFDRRLEGLIDLVNSPGPVGPDDLAGGIRLPRAEVPESFRFGEEIANAFEVLFALAARASISSSSPLDM
jgi:hypothetical protein